ATAIYTLSLHDALPISDPPGAAQFVAVDEQPGDRLGVAVRHRVGGLVADRVAGVVVAADRLGTVAPSARRVSVGDLVDRHAVPRSEEHTSELQSLRHLV